LLVDDDFDTLQIMKFVLEQNGADVIATDSVPAALERFQLRRPDVIVTDIAMAGLNGYALILEVRKIDAQRQSRTPAIAVTAFATPRDQDLATTAGFERYIAKPFDPHELVLAVVQLRR
jgi:CheY-like chemotaxis protein